MATVTKAVIAAAGFGTRFLPQTKAMPKEMLPLIDKPIIQYVVEELVEAGIKDIIIVGSSNKRAIEDHFDLPDEDLLNNLRAGGPSKEHYIEEMERIAGLANFIYLRQKGPYGTGTPLANAASIIGSEPFIYTMPDDLTVASPNGFKQIIDIYEETGASVMSCFSINEDIEYDRYGVIAGDELRPDLLKMSGITEKPGKANAPSHFANAATYLFTSDVFTYLNRGQQTLPDGVEFQITSEVIAPMLKDGKPMYGYIVQNAQRFDTGTQLEYLKTLFAFALQHESFGAELQEFLQSQLDKYVQR
jgi:UTP--glucose-1-phosphate uridylyltransferase